MATSMVKIGWVNGSLLYEVLIHPEACLRVWNEQLKIRAMDGKLTLFKNSTRCTSLDSEGLYSQGHTVFDQ